MQAVTTMALDIAKSVFQVHGVDAEGQVVIRRQLKRRYVLAFFQKLPPCLVSIQACASSHHWSRELQALGHKSSADAAGLRARCFCSANLFGWHVAENWATLGRMLDLIRLIFRLVVDLFRSRAALEAEVIVLRQQFNVLRRGKPTRLPFMATDRLVLGWTCWVFPNARDALAVVRPEMVARWHRAGFRCYWRWKSRGWPGPPCPISGNPKTDPRDEHLAAIRCGQRPGIHGDLLKLGIDIGQTSVAKYMARRRQFC